jgi:hypothetical protein
MVLEIYHLQIILVEHLGKQLRQQDLQLSQVKDIFVIHLQQDLLQRYQQLQL